MDRAHPAENRGAPVFSGTELSPGIKLFHDGRDRPPLRQRAGTGPAQTPLAQFDMTAFDGAYLSLAIDLPEPAARTMRIGTNLLLALEAEAAPARAAYIRAHFSNEEGSETLHDLIVVLDGTREARFNLDGLRIPIDLATRVWVDVVFADPAGAMIRVDTAALSIEEQ